MFHGWKYLTDQDRETILRGLAEGRALGGPYHLELDWVDRCNARCFFCNSEGLQNGQRIGWDRARRILEQAAAGGLRSVRLCGGGEPLLHPEAGQLLRWMGERGIVLDNLNTNGIVLNEELLEALMEPCVGEVRISLNFADRQTYSEAMGVAPQMFDRVCDMTAQLDVLRREHSNFGELHIQFFIYRKTAGHVRACYDLARQLGADRIILRELWGIAPELELGEDQAEGVVEQMERILAEDAGEGRVINQLESHGIGERVERMRRERQGEAEADDGPEVDLACHYCYIGWYSMTVLGDESVYPCCFLVPEPKVGALDNLKGKTVAEVWRGPRFDRFRREMRAWQLLERPVPWFGRRMKTIAPQCATHDQCPVTRGMCDEWFYREADRRLGEVRRRPTVRAWRLAGRAGRWLERRRR